MVQNNPKLVAIETRMDFLEALEADTSQKNKLMWVLLTTVLTSIAAAIVAHL